MKYDLAIIGAGPAGLMAACRATELGASVIILEKNKRPGIKLLTTGGGRCNFTNNIPDPKILASYYLPNNKFLISAFSRFGSRETINFFNTHGVTTKIEANGRVFPLSNLATDILNVPLNIIKNNSCELKYGAEVKKITSRQNKIEKIILNNGESITADNYLIATGGRSYPLTGSSGEAYGWLTQLGHKIIKPRPALVAIHLKEKFIPDLEGLSLENIKLNLYGNNKKISAARGDIIFTRNGLSGPAALNLSREIDLFSNQKYRLELDFKPESTETELANYLQKIFHSGQKIFRNILEGLIAPKFIPVLIKLTGINPEKQANSITKDEKTIIINCLKKLELTVLGLGDFDQAMVTAGGIDLKEVDPKTMRSKIISNLFFAGEILDLTGPTGGYNLQLSWSTGYIAGESSIDKNIHS
ncbi:MAG: NAD(P)/FAD-dependent oxidoreductase [Candidatus Falkowbacteria bacterium]